MVIHQPDPALSQAEEDLSQHFSLSAKTGKNSEKLFEFLEDYLHLIEEIGVLNFAKAALIVENSSKIYARNVDLLDESKDILLETFHETTRRQKVVEGAVDTSIVRQAATKNPRKQRKLRSDLTEDEFNEIDNTVGLKVPNESRETKLDKPLFLDQPNLFLKLNIKRKRYDLITGESEERDRTCRLRDYVLSEDMKLVYELFNCSSTEDYCDNVTQPGSSAADVGGSEHENLAAPFDDPGGDFNEGGNDDFAGLEEPDDPERRRRSASVNTDETIVEDINCFPNFKTKRKRVGLGNIVVKSKRDIPSTALKVSKFKICVTCLSKKGCMGKKGKKCWPMCDFPDLEGFLGDCMGIQISIQLYGKSPDDEYRDLFDSHVRPMNCLTFGDDLAAGVINIDENDNDIDGFRDDLRDAGMDDGDFGSLPLPDVVPLPEIMPPCEDPMAEHHRNVLAKTQHVDWTTRINGWHESLKDKVEYSHKRGAMDMSALAAVVLSKFPSTSQAPTMPFCNLVTGLEQRDIPRYFFACLQLTNEGCMGISKSNNTPLAVDCMVVTRFRENRIVHEDDEEQQQELDQQGSKRRKNKKKRSHEEVDSDDEPVSEMASRRKPLAALAQNDS